MSTNSYIAVENSDGTVTSVYCHWDGYLSWNGRMLVNHYNKAHLAEALVNQGNISTLQPKLAPDSNSHSFSTPEEHVTVFYGRDRGEEGQEPERYASVEEWNRDTRDMGYRYLFRNGVWNTAFGRKQIKEITEKMIANAKD